MGMELGKWWVWGFIKKGLQNKKICMKGNGWRLYAWISAEVIWNGVDAHVNRENQKHNEKSKCFYT